MQRVFEPEWRGDEAISQDSGGMGRIRPLHVVPEARSGRARLRFPRPAGDRTRPASTAT